MIWAPRAPLVQEGEAPRHQHGALRSQNLPGDTAVPLPGVLGGFCAGEGSTGVFGGGTQS